MMAGAPSWHQPEPTQVYSPVDQLYDQPQGCVYMYVLDTEPFCSVIWRGGPELYTRALFYIFDLRRKLSGIG